MNRISNKMTDIDEGDGMSIENTTCVSRIADVLCANGMTKSILVEMTFW